MKILKHLLALVVLPAMTGCAVIDSATLNDLEYQAIYKGDILMRLVVTDNADIKGERVYDRWAKRLMEDAEFREAIGKYRLVHAEGRTSTMGIIVNTVFFFIDDRVPLLEKGDIVDALMPIVEGEGAPQDPKKKREHIMAGEGLTIVRLVCKANDDECKDAQRKKHNGKLTGVLIANPENEGWPGNYSTVRVSPRK